MGTGEDGTTLANYFLACPFYLGLSFFIHKMEHLTSKTPRRTRPEHSSLAAEKP